MKKNYARILFFLLSGIFLFRDAHSQVNNFQDLKSLLRKNAANLGITVTDVDNGIVSGSYTDPQTKFTYIYFQQASRQIRVYNSIISAVFKNGSFLHASGTFVNDIESKTTASYPTVGVLDAVRSAAHHLNLNETSPLSVKTNLFDQDKRYIIAADGLAKRDIEVTLVWQPSDDKQQVTLSWNVNLDDKASPNWWNIRINAATGLFVQKDNWTVDEKLPDNNPTGIGALANPIVLPSKTLPKPERIKTKTRVAIPEILLQAPPPDVTSATYRVIPFPYESPSHSAFTNVLNPWLLAGAENNATTLGWHNDSVSNYTITRGNNVFAFLDRRANNIADATINWPDTSATSAPTLNFIHNFSAAAQPFQSIENKKSAIDNLFYWNNLLHDVTYQYGLTEVSGNFQRTNMSRGGAGNDYVQANAQDSAGYNNANFSTPVDGSSGRMQMYTWSTTPQFTINLPVIIAGTYPATENIFTAPNKLINRGPITADAAWYNDDTAGTIHNACATTAPANSATLAGKIVLIDATTCTFISKVKKAQTAGAVAVLLYYPTLLGLGGTDNTVTIPCISITTTVANSIIDQVLGGKAVSITLASGIYRDGDFDNGVVCHEYGHGVSNRLTGGPLNSSCLGNAEQGGEGWSDYLGLMMTTNWATATTADGPNPRPVGIYAANQATTGGGIRRYPYSTNMNVNPLTYANMATNTEVHATGEIWSAALWDMTWNIIQQQGSITPNLYNAGGTGGNVIAMNLVMTGMRFQSCSPGFLDARNAILAADSVLYNYAHKCAIWNAFARRGMGVNASQGLSTSATDQVVNTELPGSLLITKPSYAAVNAGSQFTLTHPVTCECQAVTGFVLKDTIPTGFTYINSTPAGTLVGNVLSFPATNFASTEVKNFSVTLQAPATGCNLDTVINDNRETATAGGFTTSGAPGWSVSNARANSLPNTWFVPDSANTSTSTLTSAGFAANASQNLTILSFYHNFNTETTYDGGVVEYSTNGTTWLDAGPLFIKNGYTTTMVAGTDLAGKKAFSGNNAVFKESMIDLSSLATAPISLRFRMASDNGVGGDGWFVDNIVRLNGCGAIVKTGGYNSALVRVDTAYAPIFVKNAALPLTLLWFYANPVGNQVVLDWKTVSEWNVRDFTIEYSTNGTAWTTLGSVNALNRSANNYSFAHNSPVKGNNYYRIRMNDADGKFTVSPVRQITRGGKEEPQVVLIPNPVQQQATLYLSKDVKASTIKVYDAAGSLVKKLNVLNGTQQIQINTTDFAPGVYMLEASGGDQKYMIRMLVQH